MVAESGDDDKDGLLAHVNCTMARGYTRMLK